MEGIADDRYTARQPNYLLMLHSPLSLFSEWLVKLLIMTE